MGLVRLFLAMVVAFGHGQLVFLAPRGITISGPKNALYAVLFFYAISGFLITFTLSRNYERTLRGTLHFYTNRFIRIFSLFWPVFAFVFFYNATSRGQFLDAKLVDQWTSLFLFGVDWRWSFGKPGGFYEAATLSLLQQSWTLGAELTFYALAPWLMRRWKLAVALLVASLSLRAFFVVSGWQSSLWCYTFFPATLCFFLFGHLAMKAGEQWPVLKSPRLGIPLVALSLGAMALMPSVAFDDLRFWTAMLLFAAGLPGLFHGTKDNRLLNWLGELSFPVYLIHFFIAMTFFLQIGGFADRLIEGSVASAILAAVIYLFTTFAASVAVYYLLETPASRGMHMIARRLLRQRAPTCAVTAYRTP